MFWTILWVIVAVQFVMSLIAWLLRKRKASESRDESMCELWEEVIANRKLIAEIIKIIGLQEKLEELREKLDS